MCDSRLNVHWLLLAAQQRTRASAPDVRSS
jgi:hypothetical protein